MDFKQQLTDDIKQAMRSSDRVTLDVLRFLLSEVKNVEIDSGPQSDENIKKIIAKQIKQMKDVVKDFERAQRSDLVEAEQQKIMILEKYLPESMGEDDVKKIVDEVVSESPTIEMSQMGNIIRAVMDRTQGRADGRLVSQLVKARLTS